MVRTRTLDTGSQGLLDYAQAAHRIGCPVGTVYALVHQQRIPHVRFGRRFVRFDPCDLDRWVADRKVAEQSATASDARNRREGE